MGGAESVEQKEEEDAEAELAEEEIGLNAEDVAASSASCTWHVLLWCSAGSPAASHQGENDLQRVQHCRGCCLPRRGAHLASA